MLALFVIVILVALALERYSVWRAQNCQNIRYECKPSIFACEPGEAFFVYSTVSNHGRRPSLTMRIEERFPKQLQVLEAESYDRKVLTNEHRIFTSTAVLRGRQQVRRYLSASIAERGAYAFSFAEFYAGDFLGFHEYRFRRDNEHGIVIYPPKIRDEKLLQAFSHTIDEIALKKQLLEDPISVCGYREYTGREPMRQISWNQSAIRNKLIVKQFDPVWRHSLTIVLDMQYHGDFEWHRQRQEFCFSLVRTLCELLERRMVEYHLVTNAMISHDIANFTSSGGMGGSFSRILYALGSAKNGCVCSVEQLMRQVCADTDHRDSILFVSTCGDEQVRRALDETARYMGQPAMALFAEELMPPEAETAGPGKGKGGAMA